jgi:hypothetical protein
MSLFRRVTTLRHGPVKHGGHTAAHKGTVPWAQPPRHRLVWQKADRHNTDSKLTVRLIS